MPVRRPLHEFDEFNLGGVRSLTQFGALGLIGLPPLLRPFPPGLVEFVPQHLKAGEARQKRRAFGTKRVEIPAAAGRRMRPEVLKGSTQRTPFQFGDALIVDNIAGPQPGDGVGALGQRAGLKSGDFFDVDIERIQEQPAVWRIGTAIGGPVVEQSVQGIETDAIGSQIARQFDQRFEVGKVADSPVARRADAVELDRCKPAPLEIAPICRGRRDNQGGLLRERGSVGQMQPV